MLQKFFNFNYSNRLLQRENKFIIAASGGIDSMVLVDLCYKAGFEFALAHCNFMLRGDDSNKDASFVKEVAENLEIPCFVKEFDTLAFSRNNKLSIQESARILRYEWFEKLVSSGEFTQFATGHHFDDKIETFFINLFRGTGVSGLRSILPRNGKCVRPLLFATRSEITFYAQKNKIGFREDLSNDENHYTRNKIRHFVIPACEQAYPGFKKGFLTTFHNLTLSETLMKKETEKIIEKIVRQEDGKTIINIKQLQECEYIELILFEVLKSFNFNSPAIHQIYRSVDGISGKKFYSETHVLIREREQFVIRKRGFDSLFHLDNPILIEIHNTAINSPVNLTFTLRMADSDFKISSDPNIALLDYDKLSFPLILRNSATGDTFSPLGMKGKKKISDFMIDSKFSDEQKNQTFVIASDNEIVWLVGYRISEKFKITPGTKRIYKIEIHH